MRTPNAPAPLEPFIVGAARELRPAGRFLDQAAIVQGPGPRARREGPPAANERSRRRSEVSSLGGQAARERSELRGRWGATMFLRLTGRVAVCGSEGVAVLDELGVEADGLGEVPGRDALVDAVESGAIDVGEASGAEAVNAVRELLV